MAGAEAAIGSGVQRVLAFVTEMDLKCLSLAEFQKLTTSFDGTVQVLIEMIEEVRKLVARTVASACEASEMLRPIGCLASDLTANVRAMSFRIHLIGLNAQIQAAQATRDTQASGLEVLRPGPTKFPSRLTSSASRRRRNWTRWWRAWPPA